MFEPTPRSPKSPVRSHVHGEDKKQDELDEQTVLAVAKAGGQNHIQAEYFNLICKAVVHGDNEKLKPIQPQTEEQIPDSDYYSMAMKLCLAYLLRHKMKHTVSCIRHEYEKCPRNTGYNKASEVDEKFSQLIGDLGSRSSSRAQSHVSERSSDYQNINVVPVTPKL